MLTIGSELSLETEARRNFPLATEPDDLDRNTLELQLEFFYPISDYSAAFIELEEVHRVDEEPEIDERETKSDWSRQEMWYYSGGWFDDTLGIQIGRRGKFRLDNSGRLYYWLDVGLVNGTEKSSITTPSIPSPAG